MKFQEETTYIDGGGESPRKGITCPLPPAVNAQVQFGPSDQYYLPNVELTFTDHLLGVRRCHTRDIRRIWPPLQETSPLAAAGHTPGPSPVR